MLKQQVIVPAVPTFTRRDRGALHKLTEGVRLIKLLVQERRECVRMIRFERHVDIRVIVETVLPGPSPYQRRVGGQTFAPATQVGHIQLRRSMRMNLDRELNHSSPYCTRCPGTTTSPPPWPRHARLPRSRARRLHQMVRRKPAHRDRLRQAGPQRNLTGGQPVHAWFLLGALLFTLCPVQGWSWGPCQESKAASVGCLFHFRPKPVMSFVGIREI